MSSLAVTAAADSEVEEIFSALEWQVIDLSRQDPLSSLRDIPDNKFNRSRFAVFGKPFVRKLASPRLEQLRRAAVLVRHHGWKLPLSEIEQLEAAGYSDMHFRTIVDAVALQASLAGQKVSA